jgi:hypothetical protein
MNLTAIQNLASYSDAVNSASVTDASVLRFKPRLIAARLARFAFQSHFGTVAQEL